MPVWDADVEISEAIALGLVQNQFPALGAKRIELVGEGWDNAAFLIDGEWLFRFPRRKMAEELMQNECRVLPYLAKSLTLPIPIPVYRGRPERGYPYPFAGYRYVAGAPACLLDWSDEERAANAGILGSFLRSLHSAPLDAGVLEWAPRDHMRRADLPYRHERNEAMTRELGQAIGEIDASAVIALSAQLSLARPYEGPERWVHGDAYACHFLADEERRICGVIDWGDAHLGDPAIDISIAFGFLPAWARAAFVSAYGSVDEETWKRAQFRALHYGLIMLMYGRESGKDGMVKLGFDILRLVFET